MSKHGGDKKRQSQAEHPIREGDEGRPRDSGGSGQRTGAVPNHPASPAAPTSRIIPPEQIAVRAYENWEARGKPAGTDREDWFEADRQLQEEIKHPSLGNVPERRRTWRKSASIDSRTPSPTKLPRPAATRAAGPCPPTRPPPSRPVRPRRARKPVVAGASNRERMVDIGRGNRQAGRQGQ